MKEVGTVLHLAKSGRLILRAREPLTPGTILVDSDGDKAAKVFEVLGPVNSPYVSTKPLTDKVKELVGARLYVLERT